MNSSILQSRYLLSLAEPILVGLHDAHLTLEPEPGTKTAGWIVGHLAVTADFARHLCGQSAICPVAWRSAFKPGTLPSHDLANYPPMTELCDTFRRVHNDLLVAASDADPAALAVENPYMPAREAFPLAGDFVAYVMSSHLAYHLGQLVAWRAAAGMGRLQGFDSPAAELRRSMRSGFQVDSYARLNIDCDLAPTPEDVATVRAGLTAFNDSNAGPVQLQRIAVYLRDAVGTIRGGLVGFLAWQWLSVDLLRVDESLRGQGYGSAILDRAEAVAREAKCVAVKLDTYEFQAKPFYEKRGYVLFGVLEGYPANTRTYYLRKVL